jgi:hypothetical protein
MATAKKTAKKSAAKKAPKRSAWALSQDKKIKALKPGRRVSKATGEPYTEVRANRSDVSRKNRI